MVKVAHDCADSRNDIDNDMKLIRTLANDLANNSKEPETRSLL